MTASAIAASTTHAAQPSLRARTAEVAAFAVELWGASGRVTAPRSALEVLQRERLKTVLQAAQRTRLYGAQGTLRALDDVTPVSKATYTRRLQDTFANAALSEAGVRAFATHAGSAHDVYGDRYVVATTSGTTGEVGVFVNDVVTWARLRAIVFSRILRGQMNRDGFQQLLKRRYRMSFVIARGGRFMSTLLAERVPPIGRLAADVRVFSLDASLSHIVQQLNDASPHLLHTYPTFLEVLAFEQKRGALHIEPETITVGSEPFSASCRQAAQAAWPKARLVETYGATECIALATACAHGALHVNEDACILEAADDALRPVPAGVAGSRLLLTNLLNTAQPLVRYELADAVEVVDDAVTAPCACGSRFRRLKVTGRVDDAFFLQDAAGVVQEHAPIPLDIAMLAIPGMLQYQLVHDRQNHVRVRFVVDGTTDPAETARVILARLDAYLRDHHLDDAVSTTVEQVERLRRHDQSQKLRQITSLVPRPPGPVVKAATVRRT